MALLELSKGSGLHKVTGTLECGGRGRKPQRPHTPQCHARLTGPPESTSSQAPSLSLSVFHCLSLTLLICFPLFLMFLSACLSLSVSLSHPTSGWRQGPSPGRGWEGRTRAWSALDAGPRSHHSRLSSRPGLGDGVATPATV